MRRIPATPLAAQEDLPPAERAADDGYAVRSADTVGASAWAPATLRVSSEAASLPPSSAILVRAGESIPRGADAILGFEAVDPSEGQLLVIAAVAPGSGVERAGQQLRTAAGLLSGTRRIRPLDLALLAAAGVERVRVLARPRVGLVVAGPKGADRDAHLPALATLVERDGGLVDAAGGAGDLRHALHGSGARGLDLVLATGRTGAGDDDDAAPTLASVGELCFHGIQLRPGGSAALGRVGGVPVVLLPGDPLACLCAYELVAGPLLRRLAGRDPALPHAVREVELARKIVSAIGSVDVCQVRIAGGRAEPLGVIEAGGLGIAAHGDGFVVVPAPLEGFPPGARVVAHLHGEPHGS